MKLYRYSFLLLGLAIVLAVTLACGSGSVITETPKISTSTLSGATQPPAATGAPSATQASVNAPTDTIVPPAALYLGDTATGGGYALTAFSVADPAKPGILYQSQEGKKLVAIDVIISNLSGDPFSANPMNAILLDGDGYTYQPELGGTDNDLSAVNLNSGEQAKGTISFTIPKDAKPASLKYSITAINIDYLKVNLAEPPAGHQTVTYTLTPNIPSSKLGDVIEQFGYSLTANTLEDPSKPGILYTAKQGYKLVAVELTLGNVSGSNALSVNPLFAYLVDTNGFIYSPELGGRDGAINSVDINVGEKAKGWVSFTIPKNAVPAYIKYEVNMFENQNLIAGLAK